MSAFSYQKTLVKYKAGRAVAPGLKFLIESIKTLGI
jgi:hypothetical protein